jgi:lantibiotic modifying enzyme
MAQRDKSGTFWNSTNDIFKGSAGIGLALLELAHLLDRPELLAVARSVGDHLLSAGLTRPEGQYWTIATDDSRHYPNFSHGTSGVAYFLIRLYEATSDARYKAAAVSAAELLSALAEKAAPNRCLVFHHEPGGTDLFYLSWCHGPSGTARLFERLSTVTGEKRWVAFAETAADSVIAQGAPEKRTPGYWNNFGLCCGTAGIGEFYLQLYRQTGRTTYLELARRCAAFLLTSASVEQNGLGWLQAENRTKPEDLLAQTGLMQGAAGIGLFLLHLYETERGTEPFVWLPDFARSP